MEWRYIRIIKAHALESQRHLFHIQKTVSYRQISTFSFEILCRLATRLISSLSALPSTSSCRLVIRKRNVVAWLKCIKQMYLGEMDLEKFYVTNRDSCRRLCFVVTSVLSV